MRVEKLELHGFKSFADKTVFNLHPGITCIVGPNGCGKSNVVDSFKWVLGEQSAKSLRGSKMEEVIFSGSQSKKPKGMSEVSMYVSGMGAQPNGGSKETTTVTRRLYRSGDSDYMLNKSSCRLRDIRDLFLDTGLEMKSYSIFEQERIAGILNAKPEDRRFLIEEVAGVVKYKVRRQEAQSKLESSLNNLQRINDIITEVRRQINSLDRQVKKAERYKRLMAELKDSEVRIAKKDYEHLKASLGSTVRELEILRQEEAALRADLASKETTLERKRIELAEMERGLSAAQERLQALEREIAEAERAIAVLKTEAENLRNHLPRLSVQIEELEAKEKASTERIDEIHRLKEELSKEIGSLTEQLAEKGEDLRAEGEAIRKLEGEIEAKGREAFRVSDEISRLRNELHTINTSIEGLKRKEESLVGERAETEESLSGRRTALQEAMSARTEKEAEKLRLGEEKGSLSGEIESLKAALEQKRSSLAAKRETLASVLSRIEALREMVSGQTEGGLPEDLRTLAPLADLIRVPKEYEQALEGALRETVKGFLVQTEQDAVDAVLALRSREAGRTAFIPVEWPGRREDNPPLPEGALGWASDLIHIEGENSHVIKSLLRGVAIFRETADALRHRGTEGLLMVTLAGEVIDPTGVFIGGKGTEVLMRMRQIRETEAEAEAARAEIALLEGEVEKDGKELDGLHERMKSVEAGLVDAEKELSLLAQRAEGLNEEVQRAERKVAFITSELDAAKTEMADLGEKSRVKEAEVAAAAEGRSAVELETARLKEELSRKKTTYEDKKAETFELKLSMNTMHERQDSINTEMDSTKELIIELQEKRGYLREEAERTSVRIKEKETEVEGREEKLKALVLRADEIGRDISVRKEGISVHAEEATALERDLKSIRSRIEPSAQRLSELNVAKTEQGLRMENIKNTIRVNHAEDIETVETEPYSEEDDARQEELRKKINDLGPVSLGSIEEYEELKERYDFLTKQHEDLQKSIAELQEAISRINTTTRKKLREAFEALKEKFSEVFVALFGGGRAELVLTDESNILETGLDVIAQPPGKRLQNITLLSGGEKTLTAISLLFSSFLIKPTPLCILDEADAALDETNTAKFAQLLKQLSKDIQFVVVTHNKVTMEVADYIYGVTMEEPGISKVISIELQAAA